MAAVVVTLHRHDRFPTSDLDSSVVQYLIAGLLADCRCSSAAMKSALSRLLLFVAAAASLLPDGM
eukprot:scaffold14974_cov195-Amphora_coffeaeformis.AAC.43